MRNTTNFSGTKRMLKSIAEVSPKVKLHPGLRCLLCHYRVVVICFWCSLLYCVLPHVKAGLLQKHGKS